jgi:endonuclease III
MASNCDLLQQPNLGKHISAKLTQQTEDEMIERIWEEYFTTLEEAVEWLQVEAEKIVRESLAWKVNVGNVAQKDIEYLNEYGFDL